MLPCHLVSSMCFSQGVASDTTQITVAVWIREFPKEWSSRTLSRLSQLSHSPLTQQTQIIQCRYQRKSTIYKEHYVAFHQLTSKWLHRYNQFGYWLTSFSYPQRMFTPSMITSFMRSCAQATLVENCFSDLRSQYNTVVRNISQPRLQSSAKSISSVLYPLGK